MNNKRVLELGRAGSFGLGRGVVPVLEDGEVVARLQASSWKEAATAVVGDREWVFAKGKRQLTGRWAADPEGSARLRATSTSAWKAAWELDLAGTTLQLRTASAWKGTHRYTSGERTVAASGTAGTWARRPTLAADESLPLDALVFLLWIELVLQRRTSSSAAGAAVVGVVAAGS